MIEQFNIEVDNQKKYVILKEIQNYYNDFINNPMSREDEILLIKEIIGEIFSEERNSFNHYIVEFFSDGKEIDFDNLKKAYDIFCLEQTNVIKVSKWIG